MDASQSSYKPSLLSKDVSKMAPIPLKCGIFKLVDSVEPETLKGDIRELETLEKKKGYDKSHI